MDTHQLVATIRKEVGKAAESLRRSDKVPAVLYGHGIKNINLFVDYKSFESLYRKARGSSLIDLQIGGHKTVKVLIQEIQRDPVSDKFIHADFHQVKMTEKIIADINLVYIGESEAVKQKGGILVKGASLVKVETLPQDLIPEVEVDLSLLKTFDDIIRVKDLKFPPGITVKDRAEAVIVSIQPPRTEAEIEALEEKVEEAVADVEKSGEKEGGEEGEGEEEDKATEDKESGNKPSDDGKEKKSKEK
ncbi:50S ribosomal protein L25 [Patescibacteria group bacterium]|nr:50S ribosomal protein L25 [Patescibacteria group bacterium]